MAHVFHDLASSIGLLTASDIQAILLCTAIQVAGLAIHFYQTHETVLFIGTLGGILTAQCLRPQVKEQPRNKLLAGLFALHCYFVKLYSQPLGVLYQVICDIMTFEDSVMRPKVGISFALYLVEYYQLLGARQENLIVYGISALAMPLVMFAYQIYYYSSK